jgi:Asp-tRNA(Asn)/Glu-tRNA(Gln) amidotransferase A subunit family amidase
VDDFGPEGMSIPFQRLISFGPMARSISDLALMLDVLMGQVRAAASGPAGRALPERLRIAVTPELPGAEPNPDTRRLFSALCAGLRQDGHEVQDAAPDITMEDASRVWGTIAGYELWSSAPPLLKNRFSRALFQSYMLRYKLGEGPFTQYFGTGMLKSQREYEDALAEREKILQSVDGFFQRYDLWLLPVSMGEAIRSQRRGSPIQTEGESEGQVDRKTVPYSLYLGAYTIPTTTFGTPVLTIPIGFGTSGLPIGIQVHGARFSDRRLLDIAERFLSKHIALRIPPAFVPPA